ncbi:MAG: hypothetical protein H7Y09_00585 [Chitinophagaceae bacterium]|nr:hypothetical protein [Anaerolineae bacterium]
MSMNDLISALLWATFTVVVSQAISVAIMWWLGLPPSKLIHEIEDVQNIAVGAVFFIITLIASIFIGLMATEGFTPDPDGLTSAAWIVGGLILSLVYTALSFTIAHRIMKPLPGEGVYGYMHREIVEEQNGAVAFFLGGLATAPFIAVVFQLL